MEKSSNKSQQSIDHRMIFVGDDTGLLKKLKMNLRIEQDVVSAPGRKKIRNKRTLDDMLNADEQDQDGE